MTAIAAPRVDTNVSPDCEHYVSAANAADVNLQTVSGKPNHCPQKLIITNTTAAAAAADIVLTPEKGVARTIHIPGNAVMEYNMPVQSITAAGSGAGISVIAFWWAKGGCQFNR